MSQAAFNASSNDNEALCLKDTRVTVLKEIKAWAYDKDERCIFWVNGVAGTGKSTIARTICDDFHKNGHLAASFFFSRSEKDRSSAQKFFSTIAWQVAHCGVPSVGKAIISALHKRPDIADLSFKEQWKCLVLQPLQQQQSGIFVIVIDALDECEDEKSVKLLVSLLLQAASVEHCRLRIVVTSRPEAALRKSFPKSAVFYRPLELHKEPGDVVDGDICLFLYDQLTQAKEEHEFSVPSWPDVDTVDRLVVQSSRLFIYAATLCKFVLTDKNHTPDKAVHLRVTKWHQQIFQEVGYCAARRSLSKDSRACSQRDGRLGRNRRQDRSRALFRSEECAWLYHGPS